MITQGTMFQLRPFEFERLLSKGDFVFTGTVYRFVGTGNYVQPMHSVMAFVVFPNCDLY